jgi:catalase (peroxidase I)
MGFGDTETVALVGGGHAIGKCHGACAEPPCGAGTPTEGIGNNTFTAGFEGAWSTTPTTFSNQYFQNLFTFEWQQTTSPAGLIQFEPFNADGSPGPDIIMLTTDLALANDETYRPIAENYAANQDALDEDFAASWYRLTSAGKCWITMFAVFRDPVVDGGTLHIYHYLCFRCVWANGVLLHFSDMGPALRCLGSMVPDPQPFQRTLPQSPPADQLPDYIPVRSAIQAIIDGDSAATDKFINLAYRCAFTFRSTDYQGGCNGARIRFSPEADWPENEGTSDALEMLSPVKEMYSDISYADLIVLAALTALEQENGDVSGKKGDLFFPINLSSKLCSLHSLHSRLD